MPGGSPPGPPSVGDVTGSFPLSLFSQEKILANERDNIFGARALRITRNPNKQMAGLVPLVCT